LDSFFEPLVFFAVFEEVHRVQTLSTPAFVSLAHQSSVLLQIIVPSAGLSDPAIVVVFDGVSKHLDGLGNAVGTTWGGEFLGDSKASKSALTYCAARL